jgi:hypothetical protein
MSDLGAKGGLLDIWKKPVGTHPVARIYVLSIVSSRSMAQRREGVGAAAYFMTIIFLLCMQSLAVSR